MVLGGRGYLTESAGLGWRPVALPYGGRIATGWITGRDLYLQDATSGDVWRCDGAVGR